VVRSGGTEITWCPGKGAFILSLVVGDYRNAFCGVGAAGARGRGLSDREQQTSVEQVADLRLGEVSVAVVDGAQVPPDLRAVIAPKVKAAMERQLSPRLKGSTPVRVEVNVRTVRIASEAETVIVGGTHGMTADVTLVDPRTKAVLLTYDAQSNRVSGGAGVGGLILDRAVLPHPVDRVTESFAFQYGEWLRPSEPRS
jgi:hypothetical protein